MRGRVLYRCAYRCSINWCLSGSWTKLAVPPEAPQTTEHYGFKGFKRGPNKWEPLMVFQSGGYTP